MKTFWQNQNNLIRRLMLALVSVLSYILLSLGLAKIWPWGSDFLYFYYPLAEKWFAGVRNIYDVSVSELFYPPWSLFMILPLGFFPIQVAHGFQLAASLVLIVLSLRVLQPSKPIPIFFVFLALVNLHSFDLYIRGAMDAVVLLGVVLGFWAIQNRKPFWLSVAFCLMVMKPPLNVSLTLLLYLISIRDWSKREWLIAFAAPFVMAVVSTLMVGIDWPIPYFKYLPPRIDYLSISIWRIARRAGFPLWPVMIAAGAAVTFFAREAWREKTTPYTLSLALAATFLFTVYANGDHYVLLIPAFMFVLQRSFKIGLLAYAVTFTPLLRLMWGPPAASVDILYPLILFFGTLYLAGKFERQTENIPPAVPQGGS